MSTIHCDTIETSSAGPVTLTKQSAAKAWWNLNGTGTIAGRDSLNVSSYDDVGTGTYDSNYTNAMANADYSFQGTTGVNSNTAYVFVYNASQAPSTTDVRFACDIYSNATLQDQSYLFGTLNGDLA